MEKGVFMLCFIFHQFRTNLLDMPHQIWRKISDFGIYCSVLDWGRGLVGLGRPYIKLKFCPFAIYSCVMEKGVFMLCFIFHQFRTNLLDMPQLIWRKISQILEFIALSYGGGDWWVGEALYQI